MRTREDDDSVATVSFPCCLPASFHLPTCLAVSHLYSRGPSKCGTDAPISRTAQAVDGFRGCNVYSIRTCAPSAPSPLPIGLGLLRACFSTILSTLLVAFGNPITKPTHRLRPFSTHRNFSHISSTPTFLRPFDASHDGLFSSPLRACLRVGLGLEHCFVPLCHCTHRHCTICPICICISLSQAASQACPRLSCTLFVYRITQPPEDCLQC